MKAPEEQQAEWDDAIAEAGAPTEKEMREEKVPTHNTIEELTDYINSLVDRPHSYGTCCYATSMAATAAFNYVASKLGITGFQASCADMDILARTRGWKWGKILNYENLLYPQYCNDSHFPTWRQLVEQHKEELAKRARELLEESPDAVVTDHWRWLISLVN